MTSASTISTVRNESSSEYAEKWRRNNSSLLNAGNPSSNVLFENLFTSDFFRSSVPVQPNVSSPDLNRSSANDVARPEQPTNTELHAVEKDDSDTASDEEESSSSKELIALDYNNASNACMQVGQPKACPTLDAGTNEDRQTLDSEISSQATSKTVVDSELHSKSGELSPETTAENNSTIEEEGIVEEQALDGVPLAAHAKTGTEAGATQGLSGAEGNQSSFIVEPSAKEQKENGGSQALPIVADNPDAQLTQAVNLQQSKSETNQVEGEEANDKSLTTLDVSTDAAATAASSFSENELPRNRRSERLEARRNQDATSNDNAAASPEAVESSFSDDLAVDQGSFVSNDRLPSELTVDVSSSQRGELANDASLPTSGLLANSQSSEQLAVATSILPSGNATPSPNASALSKSVGAGNVAGASTALGAASSMGANNPTVVSSTAKPVASGATGSTGSTVMPGEQSITEYQQSRLLQRVLKGMEKFSDGSTSVKLRLHPPELGALEMSLHMNQQRLSAQITVDSEATRQVLHENLPKLQSKLAEQGITVERFELQLQSTTESSRSGNPFFQQSGFSSGESSGQPRQGRQFGEARFNRLSNKPITEVSSNTELATGSMASTSSLNLRA